MRTLKKKLSDDKVYTFVSLPWSKAQAYQKFNRSEDKNERDARVEELQLKMNGDEEKRIKAEQLTVKELAELDALEQKNINDLFMIIRETMKKHHKEFGFADKDKDDEINKKLGELLDLRDMNQIATFAIQGTIPKEDDEITEDSVLDLTRG